MKASSVASGLLLLGLNSLCPALFGQNALHSFRPSLSGPARLFDVNASRSIDAGDRLILRFDHAVVTNSAPASSFRLPVAGNALGAGAVVTSGPRPDEVTITLGTNPALKARQDFDRTQIAANDPSGIDISRSMPANAIESAGTGGDAIANGGVDITPAFVDTAKTLDSGPVKDARLFDLDCNGNLDAITVNALAPFKVWFNDGSGGFFHAGQTFGDSKTNAIEAADVDNDGLVDIIEFGLKFRIWINHGFGNFLESFNMPTGATAQAVAGDFNEDGYVDVLRVGIGVSPVFSANGGAFWFTGTGFATGLDCRAVTVRDFDRDGHLDVAVAAFNGVSSVWLGDGVGAFSSSGANLGNSGAVGIASGDLDGNGRLDVVKGSQNGVVETFHGDGAGGFQPKSVFVASGNMTSVETADVDGDGDLDLLVSDATACLRVWLNRGDGTFFDSLQDLGLAATKWIRVDDVDSDGDVDFLAGNDNQLKRVWLNSLAGAWGTSKFIDSGQFLGTHNTDDLCSGDVDGDGDLDFVSGNNGFPTRVWLNDGSGNYSNSGQSLGGNLPTQGLAMGDVDRDGDLDFVMVTELPQNPTIVWHNDGSGGFSAGQQFFGDHASSAVLFDADGDGDPDLLTTLFDGGATVRMNNGLGVFQFVNITLGPSMNATTDGEIGDVDCDGDLDVVLIDSLLSPDKLFLNSGTGSFVDSGQLIGSDSGFGVALEDLNGDGSLDMVVANGAASEVNKVYFNDGLGNYTDSGNVFPPSSTVAVAVGDIDGDGDLDLAFGNHGTQGHPNTIWINDGFGYFTDSGQLLGNRKTAALQLGDVDADGDLDLLAGNAVAEPNEVWRNE